MSSWRYSGGIAVGLVPLVLVAIGLLGCASRDDVWPKDHAGPKVVVSFAPLYCFALNVAADDAVVKNMMTTSGPHHFNPTDKDARLLQRADLFFINGINLEMDKPATLARSSGNTKLKIVDLGSLIPEDKLFEGSCHHDHGDGVKHEHGKDPHVWLSPDYAILQVQGIRDALKDVDPSHAEGYDRRAAAYIKKLEQLKADGLALFKGKSDKNIVTFHDSMTYFARTFGINIVGVVQKNPGMEPNREQFEELIKLCADDKAPVRVITVEPQYGTSSSANEVVKELRHKKVPDPTLVEFDPLETVAGELTADWYETKMRANIEALAKAMK
jgi:ABC-type Zn uptake system ZnuABC Zn-binding protein ZnuA